MSDEKTEEPTDEKLRKARQDGEVAKSQDLAVAAMLLGMCVAMWMGGEFFADRLQAILRIGLDIQAVRREDFDLYRAMGRMGLEALGIVAPFVFVAVLSAIAGLAAQTGIVISFKPVEPKFNAISPASGFKRIFALRSLIELVKNLVKAALFGAAIWLTIRSLLPLIVGTAFASLPNLIATAWDALCRLVAVGCVLYIVVGAADYGIQKWLFKRDHRMTKDEVKREHKDSDGNPEIKSERRSIALEMAFTPPSREKVAGADAVVVNPTHYAVAIRYDPDGLGIPEVVAKGVDHLAFQIRSWAAELGVPIVANPPLARALYKVEVDAPIPEALFETVAVILRWVEQIGAQRHADAGPAPNTSQPDRPE